LVDEDQILGLDQETEDSTISRHRLFDWRKNQCDTTVELGSIDQSGVGHSYYAVGIDEHGRRLTDDSIRTSHTPALVHRNGKPDCEVIDELLHVFGAALLISPIHGYHLKSVLRVFRLHIDQLGKLDAARWAPGTPE
jgi:hypothetical protein